MNNFQDTILYARSTQTIGGGEYQTGIALNNGI